MKNESITTPLTFKEFINASSKYYLYRLSNGEKYEIRNAATIIGRKSIGSDIVIDSDIVIQDNKTISRSHAEISKDFDSVFIRDLGSKNGTYLNGRRLIANKLYEIKNGDKIRLSNEEFMFRKELTKFWERTTDFQDSMFERLKHKAKEKKESIDSDASASEEDKRIIRNVLSLLKDEKAFNKLSKGTVYNLFTFLGFNLDVDDYSEMYEQLMEDVNRIYIYMLIWKNFSMMSIPLNSRRLKGKK